MATLEELTKPLTVDEIKSKIYSALAAQGVRETSWKAGSVVRTLIAGTAIVLAAFSRLQAEIAKSGFLALASGDWLVLVARYVYGVEKDLGGFAAGLVRFDNAGGGAYAGGAGDLVVVNPGNGKQYRSTGAWVIGAGASNVLIAMEALEIGTASNLTASTPVSLVTVLNGVTASVPTSLLGRDPELDPVLRLRCNEKTGSLSPNGPRDAYAFVARSAKKADGVTSAGVTRVRVVADGAGNVTVYVATDSGGVTGSAGDPATDLGAVNKAIQEKAAPLGVTATVVSATPKAIGVTYQLWVLNTSGLTDAQLQAAVNTALDAYLKSVPIGGLNTAGGSGFVYVTALEAVVGGANPTAKTIKVTIAVPAADVAVAVNEVPVAAGHTATITQVSGGTL